MTSPRPGRPVVSWMHLEQACCARGWICSPAVGTTLTVRYPHRGLLCTIREDNVDHTLSFDTVPKVRWVNVFLAPAIRRRPALVVRLLVVPCCVAYRDHDQCQRRSKDGGDEYSGPILHCTSFPSASLEDSFDLGHRRYYFADTAGFSYALEDYFLPRRWLSAWQLYLKPNELPFVAYEEIRQPYLLKPFVRTVYLAVPCTLLGKVSADLLH